MVCVSGVVCSACVVFGVRVISGICLNYVYMYVLCVCVVWGLVWGVCVSVVCGCACVCIASDMDCSLGIVPWHGCVEQSQIGTPFS